MSLELPLAVYQVVLYTVLFVGIGALGAGVGYIVSYLVYEHREPPRNEPKALPPDKPPGGPPVRSDGAPPQLSGEGSGDVQRNVKPPCP